MGADSSSAIGSGALLVNAALQCMPNGFCVWDDAFRLVMWNGRYEQIYGFSPGELYEGMSLREICARGVAAGHFPGLTVDASYEGYTGELLANREGTPARARDRVRAGRTIARIHAYSPGLGWVVTHEDITEALARSQALEERTRELEQQNMRLDAAVNNMPHGLSMFDPQERLVVCNEPCARMYALPEPLVQPGTLFDDIMDFLFERGMRAQQERRSYLQWRRELAIRRDPGDSTHELEGRMIRVQHHPMQDGGWVSTHEDVTEQRETEARIRHLARHDALTALPNRSAFLERIAEVETRIRRGEGAAVLFIDLDQFKSVNDTLGHAVGDEVLKQVAVRLLGATRDADMLARLGGDEFSLLLHPLGRPQQAAAVAERIINAMAVPFKIDGHSIYVGASVGIALGPVDGGTAATLMQKADVALYRSKEEGRSTYRFFEADMGKALQQRRAIGLGLRMALPLGQLRLEFQPIIDLKENRITCFEALLRWDHPQMGAVSPSQFIPVAEETGLIVPIGEWVLREACTVAKAWPEHIRVAVNLSPAQFKTRDLAAVVEAALKDVGLAPERLELEITESLFLADNELTLSTLHALRAMGVRISMDDFGTGYSSLSYLRSFPFDKIKIDRTFVRDLAARPDNLAIIRAVIGLGQSLNMSITAEGVETREQLNAVRSEGCDEVQGYLLSLPLKPADAALLAIGHAAYDWASKGLIT